MPALAQTVILFDEETQKPIVLEAGTTPAKKYAKQIVNPKAWADTDSDSDEPEDDGDPAASGPADPPAADDSAPDSDETPDGDSEDDGADDEEDEEDGDDGALGDEDPDFPKPPAKNAKVATWRAYADEIGLEVADDASKADIIDAVNALL